MSTVIVDALVLSGGRGSRLGGVSKAALELDGESLLDRTLAALSAARSIVVVGEVAGTAAGTITARIDTTREEPPYSGPVAAIGAGLSALDARPQPPADDVLLLAVDMPRVAALVPALLAALTAHPEAEAVLAVDGSGHAQPLAAIHRAVALRRTLDELASEHPGPHPLAALPMRAIAARMVVATIPAPPGSTADVDTPADAAALGISLPPAPESVPTRGRTP